MPHVATLMQAQSIQRDPFQSPPPRHILVQTSCPISPKPTSSPLTTNFGVTLSSIANDIRRSHTRPVSQSVKLKLMFQFPFFPLFGLVFRLRFGSVISLASKPVGFLGREELHRPRCSPHLEPGITFRKMWNAKIHPTGCD